MSAHTLMERRRNKSIRPLNMACVRPFKPKKPGDIAILSAPATHIRLSTAPFADNMLVHHCIDTRTKEYFLHPQMVSGDVSCCEEVAVHRLVSSEEARSSRSPGTATIGDSSLSHFSAFQRVPSMPALQGSHQPAGESEPSYGRYIPAMPSATSVMSSSSQSSCCTTATTETHSSKRSEIVGVTASLTLDCSVNNRGRVDPHYVGSIQDCPADRSIARAPSSADSELTDSPGTPCNVDITTRLLVRSAKVNKEKSNSEMHCLELEIVRDDSNQIKPSNPSSKLERRLLRTGDSFVLRGSLLESLLSSVEEGGGQGVSKRRKLV